LSLHPEKTRLIEFGRFASKQRARHQVGKPETFQFLGFTFICGQSRRGHFLLKRKSRGDRMRTKLKEVKEEMRWRRHQPVREQGKWLGQVVRGFFAYHAVPTNTRALNTFRHRVLDLWRRSLKRRSQRDRTTWERIAKLADDFLPKPRLLHPWPHVRFAVNHPRSAQSILRAISRLPRRTAALSCTLCHAGAPASREGTFHPCPHWEIRPRRTASKSSGFAYSCRLGGPSI